MLESSPLTVSAFLARVNELLETQVVWVEGEVADVRVSQGKWLHFDLKDSSALVHCFGLKFRLRTPLEDGMRVRLWAVPRVYPRFGRFSLVVESLEPAGEGALRRAFELLKVKLAADGLFDAARKRTLPRFPERIALLTSPDAAAYQDFLNILSSRRGGIEVVFLPVPVQGEGAAAAIAEAIDWVNENEAELEVLVCVRGGGSLEDLHAWNDERVARALARSRLLTLVGIGHERDITLADLVADVRASTPSHAAELLTPTASEMLQQVQGLVDRLCASLLDRVGSQRDRIARHTASLRERVQVGRDRVALLLRRVEGAGVRLHAEVRGGVAGVGRLQRAMVIAARGHLASSARDLAGLERLLVGHHPARVLERGYSVTTDAAGSVIREARKVAVGEALVTLVARGTLRSQTTAVHDTARRKLLPSVRRARAHRRILRNR